MKESLTKVLVALIYLLRLVILLFVVLILIKFFSQYVENIGQFPTLLKINKFEEYLASPFIEQIRLTMPFKYQGTDLSPIIFIIFLLIVFHILTLIKDSLTTKLRHFREVKRYHDWRKQYSGVISKEKMSEIDSKFEALNASKPSDRKKLLKEFATLKTKLDSMGQQLAFLAIDVVDSTGMKRDEDKYLAVYDFDRYNQLVQESLNENGLVKFAMTPDGIMSCFRTVDDAVNAATSLMDKLKKFNLHEKKIKRNFQVRCGINAGYVYFDEDMPLEQMTDRVIDIAGHMQKYAKPDCINIAASAIEPLKNRGGFSETTDVIDEQKVFEWSAPKQ